MPRKKKKDKEIDLSYSKNESFENLKAVQNMALNKRGKDDEPSPDISLFLKAEELKGKLCGLYADKSNSNVHINVMGIVKIDGKELMPKVGEKGGEQKYYDRTSRDIEYSGETDSGDNRD